MCVGRCSHWIRSCNGTFPRDPVSASPRSTSSWTDASPAKPDGCENLRAGNECTVASRPSPPGICVQASAAAQFCPGLGRELMATIEWTSSTVPAAGTVLHLTRGGEGPPVVVLHRDIGTLARLPFYDALAQQHDVVIAHHPG